MGSPQCPRLEQSGHERSDGRHNGGVNFYEVLRRRFEPHMAKTFLTTPASASEGHGAGEASSRTVLTYGDIHELSWRAACWLADVGVRAGDRVLVQLPKSVDVIALYLGVLRLGAVYVPLNTAYTDAELDYFVGDCSPAVALLGDSRTLRSPAGVVTLRSADLAAALAGAGCADGTHDAAGSRVNGAEPVGSGHEDQGVKPTDDDRRATAAGFEGAGGVAPSEDGDLAALVYTSGTTGRPKGAMLTHANLTHNALSLCEQWAFSSDDVLLHTLPLFHVHGLMVALHTAMASGAGLILTSRFDPDTVLGCLRCATVMMGVPTHYARLVERKDFNEETCANVRLLVSGSAPMTAALHRAVAARTGHEVLERYGMSETLMLTSNPYKGQRVPGTVGFALPDTQVRIAPAEADPESASASGMVDADSEGPGMPGVVGADTDGTSAPGMENTPAERANAQGMLHLEVEVEGTHGHVEADAQQAGTPGVVEVKGPGVGPGYWNRPDATAESRTPDGWFITGDVGHLDAEGRLTLEGRQSDMIISGGLNVYPVEIEQALDAHPSVAESAVVGLPHSDLGEAVTAFVVLNAATPVSEGATGPQGGAAPTGAANQALPTDADLAQEFEHALVNLARFKHPKRYLVLSEMPRNAMGKVLKSELRSANTTTFANQ